MITKESLKIVNESLMEMLRRRQLRLRKEGKLAPAELWDAIFAKARLTSPDK